MKRQFFSALTCLSVLALYATATHAQTAHPAATSPATLVAVVDLPQVFEAHPSFKTKMDAIQQKVKAAESQLSGEQQNLAVLTKQLRDYRPTTAPYKKLESEVARKTAELQVQARQTKKEFLQLEARQYYASYQDILAAIQGVAERYNIGLVLRFDSREIDPENPQSVAMGMSRSVVLQRNLDITKLVVDELQIALAAKDSSRAPRR